MSNPTALRLRAISTGAGGPNSKVKDLCSDGAAEIERLEAVVAAMRESVDALCEVWAMVGAADASKAPGVALAVFKRVVG